MGSLKAGDAHAANVPRRPVRGPGAKRRKGRPSRELKSRAASKRAGKTARDPAAAGTPTVKGQAAETRPPEQLLARLQALPREKLPDDRLEVSYILATDPGSSHQGRVVESIAPPRSGGDEGNTVLMKVKIDKSELASAREPRHRRDGESRLRPPLAGLRAAARRNWFIQ